MTITRRKPIPFLPYFRGPEQTIEGRVVFSPEEVWGFLGAMIYPVTAEVDPKTDTVTIRGTVITRVQGEAIDSDSVCRQLGLHYHPNGDYLK